MAALVTDKTCKVCFTNKPAGEFTNLSASPDGLAHICRDCAKAQREARRASQPAGSLKASRSAKVSARQVNAGEFIQPNEVLATWAAVQMIARDGGKAPNMLFKGPSGCGKTESARDLARRSGLPFVKIDAPAIVDPEAWFGTREVVDGDKGPVTVYHPSAFAEWLQKPCLMLIDEANRVSDAIRNILIALFDDSRAVTNPLTGQVIERHPLCFIILTANVGLAFTGTYAIDPAFLTRALTTNFDYLDAANETAVVVARTQCTADVAALFVRFANETRQRAKQDEDFSPISTREVLAASGLVAKGLDANVAARQAIINAASDEGGAESMRASMEYIWKGIYETSVKSVDETGAEDDDLEEIDVP